MHEELISKKDLLNLTQISYGQLYRWKRKNLIPEEWFIKKSVSTGQETFFPKDRILERINTILELKDDASLDELASKFSNEVKNVSLLRSYIIERNIVSEIIVKMFEVFNGVQENFNEISLFSLLIYNELIESNLVSGEVARDIAVRVKEEYIKIEGGMTLIVKRKLGVTVYYIVSKSKYIDLDSDGKVICEINLDYLKEQVKKYSLI